jgi:hypothetical protein
MLHAICKRIFKRKHLPEREYARTRKNMRCSVQSVYELMLTEFSYGVLLYFFYSFYENQQKNKLITYHLSLITYRLLHITYHSYTYTLIYSYTYMLITQYKYIYMYIKDLLSFYSLYMLFLYDRYILPAEKKQL